MIALPPADWPVILAIGLAPDQRPAGFPPDNARMIDIHFGTFSSALLAQIHPALVVTPLISRGGDAGLVAQALSMAGYQGVLRVICPPLPNPGMIARELRAMGPGLKVELMMPV